MRKVLVVLVLALVIAGCSGPVSVTCSMYNRGTIMSPAAREAEQRTESAMDTAGGGSVAVTPVIPAE